MIKSDNFFDEVKRLQEFQNDALDKAIIDCNVSESEKISSEKLKEIVCSMEKTLMSK
jgi:hypothetical protein